MGGHQGLLIMEIDEKPIDPDLLAKSVIETALPAYMLYLAAKTTIAEGYVIRADVASDLNKASAASFVPLKDFPHLVKKAAIRVDTLAQSLLNKLNPNETVHALYVSAMLAVLLVDEGLYADTKNISVLTSLVLLDDLRMEENLEDYEFKESLLQTEARQLLHYLQGEGLYRVATMA